jgi:hypothetical protein
MIERFWRRRVRVVRRAWMEDETLRQTLRGRGEDPLVTGLLNVVSRKEEEWRLAADRTGLAAEDRAFLNGAANGLREVEELVEGMLNAEG